MPFPSQVQSLAWRALLSVPGIFWISDFGFQFSDLEFQISDTLLISDYRFRFRISDLSWHFSFWDLIIRIFDFRFQISDFGLQIFDFRFWILDFGFWISNFGYQISGSLLISDFRFRISDLSWSRRVLTLQLTIQLVKY